MKQLRLYYGVFLLVGILASCIHAQYRLDEMTMMMRTVIDNQKELLSKSEDVGCTSTLADLHISFKSDDPPAVSDGKVKQHDVNGPSQEEWVAIIKDLSVDILPKFLEENNYTLHANQTGVLKESVVAYNHSYEIHGNWTSKIYQHYHVQGHQTNMSMVIVMSKLVNGHYTAIGTFATKRFFKEEGKQEVFTTWSGVKESWVFTKNFNGTYDLTGNVVTTEDGNIVVKNKKTAELLYHASYLQNTSNHISLSFQDIKETMKIGKGLTHFIGSANLTTETLNVTQDVTSMKQAILLDQILQSSSRPSDPITFSKFRGAVTVEDDKYSVVSTVTSNGCWGNMTMSLYYKGYYCEDGTAPIKMEEPNPLNNLLKTILILF